MKAGAGRIFSAWSASVSQCSIEHDGGMVLSLESDDAGSSSVCVFNHEGGMVLSDVSDDERSW